MSALKTILIVSHTRARTVWRLQIDKKFYFATAYPNSAMLNIETEARHPLSRMRAPKVYEAAAKMIEDWRAAIFANVTP